jgi:hypothetical protein
VTGRKAGAGDERVRVLSITGDGPAFARAGGGPQFWLIVGVAGAWPGRNHAAAYHILRRCARTVSLSHTHEYCSVCMLFRGY